MKNYSVDLLGIIKHGPAALQSLQILTLALVSVHMRPSVCEKEIFFANAR